MPGSTPIYGWPFQSLPDPPDGASLGEDLALAIEATVAGLFTDVQEWSNPIASGITLGTGGSVAADYIMLSDIVAHVRLRLTLGSSGFAVGTNPTLTPPFTSDSSSKYVSGHVMGQAAFFDDSTGNRYPGDVIGAGGPPWTTIQLRAHTVTGSTVIHSQVSATVPFTWAASDRMHLDFLMRRA